MSILDKISDANKARKQKAADLAEERGDPYLLGMCEYIGGYGKNKKANGMVKIFEHRIEFSAALSTKFNIDMVDVNDILVEGHDEISKRVTATRVLAFGIFALALQKKSKDQEAYVTFVLNTGEQVAFRFDKSAPIKLRTKLAPLIAKVKATP